MDSAVSLSNHIGVQSCTAKLQKELERMDHVRDVLKSSDQLTAGMTSMLDAFERRLASLEETVLPVYHETGNLQRRKQNIEKTLSHFDHVISYYNVSKEVDPIIRSGPGATNTETYLMAMARLQDALTFFQSNNSQSVELENVLLLFNTGMEMLNKEFTVLVSKYSKHLAPVTVLDMIEKQDLDTPSESYNFDIPENVMQDVRLIANWLSNHSSVHYMTSYGKIRSVILVRTLQELQKHHRSRSNNSCRSGDTTLSPSQFSRVRSESLTPSSSIAGSSVRSRVAPRRLASRLEKKATRMLSRAQHSLSQAGVQIGSSAGASVARAQSEVLEDMIDDAEVETYLTTLSALLRLFGHELNQLTLLVPAGHLRRIFQTLIEEPLAMVVRDGETMAQRARRCIGRQDFMPVLCLFPLVSHLMSMRADFERLLQGCDPSVRNRISGIVDVLHQTCVRSLDGFMDWVDKEPDRQLPRDGTVHQRTSNVLMYCEQLVEYVDTVGWMLCQHSGYNQLITATVSADKNRALLGLYISRVLDALAKSLVTSSELYSDVSLRSIFRLNNYHYLQQSTQQSGLMELMSLSESRVQTRYRHLVSEQKRLYTHSWDRALQTLAFTEEIPTLRLEIDKLTDAERKLIKDKFSTFNREIEDLCKLQREYSVPDVELRETLKRSNKECVLPKYSRFYDRYGAVTFSKNREKYVRFTPAQISVMIDSFFDTAA